MEHTHNPLQKYFRAATMSTRLPSMGKFQDEGNIGFTPTGEVSVMAMRAADEMMLKNPDALMSGLAISSLLESCVPQLRDPKQLPTPDVDALLLAIRAASFGNEMQVEAECPACSAVNEFMFDITYILDTITPLESEYMVRISDDVIVYVKPFNFESSTQISTAIFQETRKMQMLLEQEASDEDRQAQTNSSYKRLRDVNIRMMADSVEKVVTPEGTITNRDHIFEYVHNVDRKISTLIENKIKEINNSGLDKSREVTCAHCKHEWTTTLEFDPSTFFAQNS